MCFRAAIGFGRFVGHHVGAVLGRFIAAVADRLFDGQIGDRALGFFIARLALFAAMPAGDGLVELATACQSPAALAVHFGVFGVDIQCLLEIDQLGFIVFQLVARFGHGRQRRDVPGIELEHFQAGLDDRVPIFRVGRFFEAPLEQVELRRAGEAGPLFVVAVFLHQVIQELPDINRVGRIAHCALLKHIGGVVEVIFGRAAAAVLETLLQSPPFFRRNGLSARAVR